MSKDATEIYDVVPVFAVDESGKALITEEQYSWLCNYAVRKAERVQELEGDCDYLSHHYGLEAERNKRYREVLIYVMKTHIEQYHDPKNMLEDIKFVVNEALEGEE